MSRLFSALILTLCAVAVTLSPDYAAAKSKKKSKHQEEVQESYTPATDHNTTPLMVIRFNQRKVYYERPLYEAVGKAVQAKPGVRFTLLSVVPKDGEEAAERSLNKVHKTMLDMGVPESRIAVEQRNASVADPEVHVFVR